MKKLIAAALTFALAVSMSVSAMAATVSSTADPNNTATVDVKGTFNAGFEAPIVYSVDVEWGAMSFTYHAGDKTWNPADHSVTEAPGTWTAYQNEIFVTNHSNAEVTVTLAYDSFGSDASGVIGTFLDPAERPYQNSSFTLESAVGTLKNCAPKQPSFLQLSGGRLASTATTATKIGTITVTIS